MGIAVTSTPMPNPAINLATRNIEIVTEPEHNAAPIVRIKAPS
jgi:hypothetical protein